MSIQIKQIEWPSVFLDAVQALHRGNSSRLGFFPRGAFDEHARAKQILLALGNGDELLGYLLYRVAKGRAIIVHLCTAANARGRGVARALVEHLKEISQPLQGIGLHCRQDYDAKHVWAKFGFVALHRKTGRSQDGHELTFWWFDHEHPDLFSRACDIDERRLKVVIDANVFFDLQGRESGDSEDSKALWADWVQSSIELFVTKEIHNEIDRACDSAQRARSKAAITRFSVLNSDDCAFQAICEELRPHFPESAVLRDESDLRQIAYAIAGKAVYFVTRDQQLVERCESLYDRHGLKVLHPAELISQLDVIECESKYRPAQIAGSHLQSKAVKACDQDVIVDAFRDKSKERTASFRKVVLHCLSRPREIDARIVADRDQRPIIFGVIERVKNDQLAIPVLRAADHPLAPTLVRNFLRSALEEACRTNRTLIRVTESGGGDVVDNALAECGFAKLSGVWTKIAIRLVGGCHLLHETVTAAASLHADQSLAAAFAIPKDISETLRTAEATAAIEFRFWPAKILGAGLPTFIIPIRSEWAEHFFDDDLASQYLFGLKDELLLGIEGAYYCSAKNSHLTAPARILWYVSKGSNGEGSMSIKACSRLEELIIGKPKELFKRFQRLGVYKWKDVFHAAKNNLDADILAFRFSMTERFLQPIDLHQLEKLGLRGPFLSPRSINDDHFSSIYSHGCALH